MGHPKLDAHLGRLDLMLLTEGAHLAHLKFFDNAILPMSKATFYFVIGVLVLTDVVQTRYRNKLTRMAAAQASHGGVAS